MAARLSAVPDAPPRALGLVRVSKEREDMCAPELQRTAIEDHCSRRGYRITGWIEGIDESGSQRRSSWWAKLDEAVGAVESGDVDVLVVWRFSRTARRRLRWAVAIDRVETAGGLLESATEPLDTSTASGRLARGMLAEFAAYEAETIGNTWREVHARRTARGLPANGKPRFGYVHVDGIHRPDPITGPVLAELYRRYVAGETLYGLAAWLNQEGVTPVAGYQRGAPRPWTQTSVRQMLDTGFGAGLLTVRGSRQRGIHEPVIDEPTWNAYLTARDDRRTLRRGERSPMLLTGLLWCGHCGARMSGYRHELGPRARCLSTLRPGLPRHPGQYLSLAPVEDAVWEWLAQFPGLDQSADTELASAAHRTRRKQDAQQLTRQVIELDKAIGRLVAQQAQLPGIAYQAGLDELMTQRSQVEKRRVRALAEADAGEPAKIAADLLAHRDAYSVEHLRAMLRRLVARVVVTAWPYGATQVRIDPHPGGA